MQPYAEIEGRILALMDNEDDTISLMATVAAELYQAVEGFDWVGFYRVTEPGLLKIGPYQGGHGCLVIPFDKGVCGAAAGPAKPSVSMMLMLSRGISPALPQPGLKSWFRSGMARVI